MMLFKRIEHRGIDSEKFPFVPVIFAKAAHRALLLPALLLIMSQSSAQLPMIIAHRGASHDAPENTLAAVRLGWQQQADAVEVDVHLSRDHRIMVIHDKDTRRTTGKNFVVRNTDAEVLRTLDAGSGEKIPFLEEVIETIPVGKKLFIEVKTDTVMLPYLIPLLDASLKQNQLVVISFDFEVCAGLKKVMPQIPVYFLKSALGPSYPQALIDQAGAAGLDGLNLRYRGIRRELIEEVHRNGMEVYAWTVDDPETARNLAGAGIDGITTNRPAWLREKLRQARPASSGAAGNDP